MNFVSNMISLQLTLFCLMLIGIVLKKLGILTPAARASFSDMLVNIILPCNTINSFLGGISATPELMKSCILAVVISAVIQGVSIFTKPLFRKMSPDEQRICTYGMIVSNSSYIGLPIAEALYGPLGIMFTSIFQIPIRLTMWTSGLAQFTVTEKKGMFKKLITHPCIVALIIGFLLLIFPVKLPAFLSKTILTVSRCTTPVSMFVIGSILADTDVKTIISWKTLYFSFLRLIAFPLLVWLVLKPFGLDPMLLSIAVILTAMPAGSLTSILADKYHMDSEFASKMVFVSTLLSMVTVPLFGLILD